MSDQHFADAYWNPRVSFNSEFKKGLKSWRQREPIYNEPTANDNWESAKQSWPAAEWSDEDDVEEYKYTRLDGKVGTYEEQKAVKVMLRRQKCKNCTILELSKNRIWKPSGKSVNCASTD